ncbi:ABC transporter ATP-binding protein [Candidatus Anaplasma sp. TIGMIC]|uniref:ABC transporter ATP-binding protein n=1 Tax=Candidatus Anaplasma sp. TIGMIC TaxID=3020713 RepID=UPI00232E8843|nr:ABC transporter ATP-binding protein [Candidatus Anaplasma sp. TIGMIC]MDB1135109.1 ABC transporter ATP-binding protein [Candidatus Anaplasma sp. TIGMIC]
MDNGLKLSGVSHRYRKSSFLLEVEDFSGKKGEVVCLLGPSGCGKSTILKLIAGLEHNLTGTIEINGKIVSDACRNYHVSTEKRNVGLIFQHPALFQHQTVVENVAFAVKESSRDKRVKHALKALDTLGISNFRDAYPHMLSGGQQQLVTIARTMAQDPDIVLLDEPFSNLDVMLRAKMRTEVLSVIKSDKITVVLVTHDPEEALEMADKIYVMRDGKIVQCGSPYEIYNSPKDAHLARFFCTLNYCESVVRDGMVSLGLGSIKADTMENGSRVAVCIRPEAIVLRDGSGTDAVVKLVRFFNNMVYITTGDSAYWMKFYGSVLPEVGDTIRVSLDHSKALLFKL